ncbi:P-loop NTPase fold protein [Erwinia sp. 1181_3]|uniref:P-loop NTPase fold protein n=1 Tax=Erwinia sp. 1181_3 TaxID=2605957 RepID=UPI00405939CB
MKNTHAQEFLEYYLSLKAEPRYAVLINGEWGAGKTWFVDSFLEDYKKNHPDFKMLKVSLYGVNSLEQIENEFFKQMHPILSSKKFVAGSRIIKSFLKGTIKIDLDGDGKDDASLNVEMPTIDLKDFIADSNKFALVFDDVERTTLTLPVLLGYINHFVELGGVKAILVADEMHINAMDPDYSKAKEKLIGKTLLIEPDVESSVHKFITLIDNTTLMNIFKCNIDLLVTVHSQSGFNNVRILRQAFFDFERLYNSLDQAHRNHKSFIRDLLCQFLIYAFEHKSGGFTQPCFETIDTQMKDLIINTSEEHSSAFLRISRKYTVGLLSNTIFHGSLWGNIICHGIIEKKVIHHAVNISSYFRSECSAPWERLWNYHDLTDDDLEYNHSKLKERLESDEVECLGEILMSASILIELVESELSGDTYNDVKENIKGRVDGFLRRNEIAELHKAGEFFGGYSLTAWQGMGYLARDNHNFKEIVEYVKKRKVEYSSETLPEMARKLIEDIKSSKMDLIVELSSTNNNKYMLYEKSFLNYIRCDDFVEAFIDTDAKTKREIITRVKYRYDNNYYPANLKDEFQWLNELRSACNEKIEGLGKTILRFYLRNFVKYALDPSIENQSKLYCHD